MAAALGGARALRHEPRRRQQAQDYLLTMYDYPSGNAHIRALVREDPDEPSGCFPPDERQERLPADRLRRLRPARRERSDQEQAPIPTRGDFLIHLTTWRRQLRSMGAGWDWNSEVVTCEPEYYRWEPVDLPEVPRSGPGLPRRLAGRLVPQRLFLPASRSTPLMPTAGAAAHASRKCDLHQLVFCARPNTLTSCSTSPASTRPSRSGSCRPTGIGTSEGAEVAFTTAPVTTASRAGTGCASSPRGRTRCTARPSWSCARTRAGAELQRTQTAPPRSSLRLPVAKPRSSGCRPAPQDGVFPSYAINPVNGERIPIWIPTTSWPATARARSWPSPPTTSATSNSPQFRPADPPRHRRSRGYGRRGGAPMETAFVSHGTESGGSTPDRTRGCRRSKASPRSLPCWRSRAGARPRSTTGCATG